MTQGGPWRNSNLRSTSAHADKAYTIINPETGKKYTDTWAFSRETMEKMIKEKRILWKDGKPRQKEFLFEMKNDYKAIISNFGLFDSQINKTYLLNLMGREKLFSNPKPLNLLKYLLKVSGKSTITVLDFFSGSGTTADAVMQLNAEDGGNRKFIMVQLPEEIDEKQTAYKEGYHYITEIGEDRIRRAGKKIKEEHPEVDTGFRVFKVDSPNMESTYKTPDKVNQQNLLSDIRNVKEGRNDLDLLYQVMLDWGLELSLPYQVEMIENTKIHNVFDNTLLACFSDELNSDVIRKMAEKKPLRVVFKDSSFKDSATKINVSEIFKEISPETKIKVI